MLRRPPARRRGPGVINTVARTAVIAGTATAATGAVVGHQQKKAAAAQQQQQATQEVQQLEQQVAQLQADQIQAQVPTAPAPAASTDLLAQLTQLGDLKERGLLTDAEFQAAKAALLGS